MRSRGIAYDALVLGIDTRNAALAATGFGLGFVVTLRLHSDPQPAFWGGRIGSTPFRIADLPVGGSIGLVGSLALGRSLRGRHRALSLGAALAPPLMGLLDPLPGL
jgi:hypothetical protein